MRVLYDRYGSMSTPSSLWTELCDVDVDVRVFNPFSFGAPLEAFLRDHRKSVALDGEYGSVGGVCIADERAARSPETGLPYRDSKTRIAHMLQIAAAAAWERLWLADAYFMAGPGLNQALMGAARDGVDVRLLLPAMNDLPLVGAVPGRGTANSWRRG